MSSAKIETLVFSHVPLNQRIDFLDVFPRRPGILSYAFLLIGGNPDILNNFLCVQSLIVFFNCVCFKSSSPSTHAPAKTITALDCPVPLMDFFLYSFDFLLHISAPVRAWVCFQLSGQKKRAYILRRTPSTVIIVIVK